MSLDAMQALNAHPYMTRFANQPALLPPGEETWLVACLRGHAEFEQPDAFAGPFGVPEHYGRTQADRLFATYGDVAVIPVRGALLHNSMARSPYATGYDYLRAAAQQAEADPDITGIAYLHDSNGGEVAGNFDLVDDLAKLTKPSVAIVDEKAFSASYSLASAADRIVVARTGGVGSIGVLTTHVDLSKAVEKFGANFSFIFAGKHKVDGNPFEPLSDATRSRLQGRIDGLYNEFVDTVARNRGLASQAVRDTEALTFSAEEGVARGLADAVMPPREALAAFHDELHRQSGDMTMSTEKTPETASLSPADLDAARAEGATAERERIAAIMGSDEAKARPAAAGQLAYKTNMNAAGAADFLAGLPEERPAESTPARGDGAFAQAMASTPNPGITPEGGEQAEELSAGKRILADYHAVTGRKTAH